MKKTIIVKTRINKHNKQKLLTVPKDCDIEVGDYVKLEKVE